MKVQDNYPMPAETFDRWVTAMKASGRAKTLGDLQQALGITHRAWYVMRNRGMVNRRTALAMSALALGIEPWK